MGLIQELSINITLSYRIYNLVITLTRPLSEQLTTPLPNPWKGNPSRVGIERSGIGPANGLLLHKSLFFAMVFHTNKTLQFFQKLSTPKLNSTFAATCS